MSLALTIKARGWALLLLSIVGLLVAVPLSFSQPTSASVLDRLLSQYEFADADIGSLLFDPTNGYILEAHRPDELRIPASTSKVVTLIAALQILGTDYRFATSLLITGEVNAGTLHGDIYLRGGGDPTFTTDDLREFVSALRRVDIKRITGRFAFDESFLPATREINAQQPIAVSYNPGLSGLSINYNRILLRWKHKPRSPAFIASVVSPAEGGAVPLEGMSIGPLPRDLDHHIPFLLDGTTMDRWLLSSTLPAQGQVELPLKAAPGRITAILFRTLCRQQGIDLPIPQSATAPAGARVLYMHQSETLPGIVAGVLRYSNNLSAELIGQVAIRTLRGHPLPLLESAAVLTDWYRQTLPHTDWNGFFRANHSGLSNATRHSPRQMADILRYGWTLPVGKSTFPQLLPPPHWEREDNHSATVVRAKSGTMDYADGLIGFLTTTQGRQLGFVILLTDFPRRAALDANFDVRVTESSPAARAWTERAKALEQALVTDWIAQY
ncbi:MAG: D-alanyl-D-alanine carboxypeptidase/D-alanyl-D-alanine-endopeptidase [Deltaproteobacteria bacterium]|nr:D-alanyl-D-alanine carboxypeptidase/D-alanyl-D-alanine-endopeptidase [Deltaproteobacteria bacterium]